MRAKMSASGRPIFATRTPVVFWASAGFVLLFVVLAFVFRRQMEEGFGVTQNWVVTNASWFLILVVNGLLGLAILLLFGPYGRMRIGKDHERPEFGTLSWLAMLFSAGMGIGLIFWSVAEPISHFEKPPIVDPRTPEAASRAMLYTFFHWGLHAWGIYAVAGLSLGYFAYRHGFPLTVRSAFAPLLGLKIRGPIGHLVDTLAVLATMFGVATSLGFGVMQISAGLDHLGLADSGLSTQLVLIVAITAAATLSVVLGLDHGIRRLSEGNVLLAGVFLLFVLCAGPTVLILNGFIQNTGAYVGQLIRLSTWTDTYRHTGWQASWTAFYWAWWIAWAPFVGMFIARISRGRTIREFVLGVLFVPVVFTFVWLTVFGTSALQFALAGDRTISAAVEENVPTALFVFLEKLPLSAVSGVVAIVVIVCFFITSSDSGSLVIDIITAGGDPDPPVGQRIFWAVLEGVVASALLVAGGLTALQTASITTGLPFALVLACMALGLLRMLRRDREIAASRRYQNRGPRTPLPVQPPGSRRAQPVFDQP